MINSLIDTILSYREFVYFILSVVVIILVIFRTGRLIDRIFDYLNYRLVFSKPMSEVKEAFIYLDDTILEKFGEYCILNFEHRTDVTINGDTEDKMVKDITVLVIDTLSPGLVSILSRGIDVNKLTDYITNKVMIATTDYAVNKNSNLKK